MGCLARHEVRMDWPMGTQMDRALVCELRLVAQQMGLRSQARRSCFEDSHHGSAVAGTQAVVGSHAEVACHGGYMDSHRETPRCWKTRPMGRAASLRVYASNDSSAAWNDLSDAYGTNDAVSAPLLRCARRSFETSVAELVLDVWRLILVLWKVV